MSEAQSTGRSRRRESCAKPCHRRPATIPPKTAWTRSKQFPSKDPKALHRLRSSAPTSKQATRTRENSSELLMVIMVDPLHPHRTPTVSYGLCHRPPVPRRACVEPRPLPQVGPRGDSLLACGVRQWRRPSRPERARGREAHWAVAASLPEKSQAASDSVACQQFRCLALNRRSRSPLT